MQEVTVNNEKIKILGIQTFLNGIGFTMKDISVQEAVEKYAAASEIYVSENDEISGIYKNLVFASATVDTVGNVTLKYTIQSENDMRLKQLETSQAEQDAILAEILFGETEGIAGEDADGRVTANGSTVPESSTTEDSHTVPDTENDLESDITADTENRLDGKPETDTENRLDGDTTADINAVEDSVENAGKEENADE